MDVSDMLYFTVSLLLNNWTCTCPLLTDFQSPWKFVFMPCSSYWAYPQHLPASLRAGTTKRSLVLPWLGMTTKVCTLTISAAAILSALQRRDVKVWRISGIKRNVKWTTRQRSQDLRIMCKIQRLPIWRIPSEVLLTRNIFQLCL